MDIENIARVAHNVNKDFCLSLGDNSQPTWEDAPEWQKASAISGVEYIMNNPESTPSDSHESWLAVKLADGWVYGDVKDLTAKTHPCIMQYDDLPTEQKSKDYIFRAIVFNLIV